MNEVLGLNHGGKRLRTQIPESQIRSVVPIREIGVRKHPCATGQVPHILNRNMKAQSKPAR